MAVEKEFDAIIIGSGQGGTPLATALAARGLDTALVEMRQVGGTCVNFGCTPTKTMIASAQVAHAARRAAHFGIGIGATEPKVDMVRVRQRKRDIVSSFRGGSENRIESADNLELIRGRAAFRSSHTLDVTLSGGGARSVSAQKIFINTGTRPAVPSIAGLDTIEALDNESIMELDRVPEHLVIVGGGYIGVEFGQMFRRFGARVTIVQRQSRLLPREDADLSDAVAELLTAEGIDLVFDASPSAVSASSANGSEGFVLSLEVTGKSRTISGSHLLLAAGRAPNTDHLNPGAAGLKLDGRGYIKVNDRLEAGVEGVWALGDVKGGPAFTHISYDDYRVLVRNVFEGGKVSISQRLLPYTVFIDPQLGRVGIGEDQARAAGRKIRVASMPMSWVARALESDDSFGLMKAVVDAETDRILGFGMIGMQAGEIAGAVQIAMMGGLPYTALRDGVFSHPTLMEALNNLFASFKD